MNQQKILGCLKLTYNKPESFLKVAYKNPEKCKNQDGNYYPFGLTMAGISDKAAGGLENRYKYNGIELDTSLGLNEYEAALRNLDPQTGRWWQVDPETENQERWSPYTSNNDNPILYKDPRGNEGEACCGGIVQLGEDAVDIYRAIRGGENILDAAKGIGISAGSVINGISKLIEFDQGGLINVGPKDLPINKDLKTKELTLPPDTHVLIQPADTKTEQHGGGKNAQHANRKARGAAEKRYNDAKVNRDELNSKPNKTKEDKQELDKLNKQVKHEKQKMDNAGENHSRKAKGSN